MNNTLTLNNGIEMPANVHKAQGDSRALTGRAAPSCASREVYGCGGCHAT